MKKFRLIAMLLMAVMLLSCCALADVITTGDVNLREGPGTNYSIIATIPEGERLAYLGDNSDGNGSATWYNVAYNGMEGWISAKYAEITGDQLPIIIVPEEEPEEPETAVIREVSLFWKQDLAYAAEMLGLPGYQESLSPTPKKYFDNDLTIAGNDKVVLMALNGNKYTIFGVTVDMNASMAAAQIMSKGLVFAGSEPGSISFSFPVSDTEGASSSIIELKTEEGRVTAVEWRAAGI